MSTLLITFLMLFVAPAGEAAPELISPYCDPRGGRPRAYTSEEKEETRARVQAVCRHVKASPIICAYMDAVVARESSGRSGVRHTLGENENGLGPMSLSLYWQRDKWPGDDEDPMFCHPEVSALVTLAIMDRAVRKYHAETIPEIQAIFAGRWRCWEDRDGDRKCRAVIRNASAICSRMEARGHRCGTRVTRADLGSRVAKRDRRSLAARLVDDFNRAKNHGEGA